MADIYRNAYITIAATSARNSRDGLRHLVHDRYKARLVPSTGLYVRESFIDFTEYARPDPELHPLTSRAWVFQERRLSPRTLSFSTAHLVWECRTTRRFEGRWLRDQPDIDTMSQNFRDFQDRPKDTSAAWQNAVCEYSRLQLTYDSDKLPAIAALASSMLKFRHNDAYLAGLWKSTLLYDLQWISILGEGRCASDAPTWSWASVKGEVGFEDQPSVLSSVTLTDLVFTPDGPQHIGKCSEARITIKGLVAKLSWRDPSLRRGAGVSAMFVLEDTSGELKHPEVTARFFPDYDLVADPHCKAAEGTYSVLFLTTWSLPPYGYSGIALRKQYNGVHERIGWLRVHRRVYLEDDPDQRRAVEDYIATLSAVEVTVV